MIYGFQVYSVALSGDNIDSLANGINTYNNVGLSELNGLYHAFGVCDYPCEACKNSCSVYCVYDILSLGNIIEVTSDLFLPVGNLSYPEIIINWTSSEPSIISNKGKVTRQIDIDQDVVLKATITRGLTQLDKTFNLTVKAISSSINNNQIENYQMISENSCITITGIKDEKVTIYDVMGRELFSRKYNDRIRMNAGIYIVRINNFFLKVVVR